MSDQKFPIFRTKVVKEISRLARAKYVHPEMGEKIAGQLVKNLEHGKYDGLNNEQELAAHLTIDLREVSNDMHWYVAYDPDRAPAEVDPEHEKNKARFASYLEYQRRNNFGFEKVERLKGNVGYIDLRSFQPSEYGGDTAAAAMSFVANSDALIFDLRHNNGGYPSMVQLIISYLIDVKPVMINTFYYRPTNDTQQFWTFPHVPGRRMPDIPVYVLTSKETGSGAEEFAYDLKVMQRATLIGETTLGSAHPFCKEIVCKVFAVHLPYGKPINPITGTNWEATGVEPHIVVPAADALKTAHLEALKLLMKACKGKEKRAALEWELEILRGIYSPLAAKELGLRQFTGVFGKRKFDVKEGSLVYTVQGINDTWPLTRMSENTFHLEEDLIFEFKMDDSGQVKTVNIRYKDGRPSVTADRS